MLIVQKFPVDITTELDFHIENMRVKITKVFKKGQLILDQAKNLMNEHRIPIYLEEDIILMIWEAIDRKTRELDDHRAIEKENCFDKNLLNLIDLYERRTAEFSTQPVELVGFLNRQAANPKNFSGLNEDDWKYLLAIFFF